MKIKKIISLVSVFSLLSFQTSSAIEIPIYIGIDEFALDQNSFILDQDDTGGSVQLVFGRSLNAFLEHNGNDFIFSGGDINFSGGELQDFRVENSGTEPTCDTNYVGRIYYDVSENKIKVCNGTFWEDIATSGPNPNGGGVYLQARAAASATSPTVLSDFEFSITDYESVPSILDHDDVLRDRFVVFEGGIFEVGYTCSFDIPDQNNTYSQIDIQFTKNDSIVVPGSDVTTSSFNDSGSRDLRNSASNTFLIEMADNDFFSMQMNSSVSVDLTCSVNVREKLS